MNGHDLSHHPGPTPLLESGLGDAALVPAQVQDGLAGKILVRVTSVRRRLLDEDNLCEKYHVDCCRYAGFLSHDDPGKTSIKTTQRKAGKKEGEFVLIEITDTE